MSAQIHSTAIVHPDAKIGHSVDIGPYATIDEHVSIADGVSIGPHCVITGRTTIGANTRVFTGSVIGSEPQDKKFKSGEVVYLDVGENNIFREYCTVNTGTQKGGGVTRIGDHNLFMAYAHIAHDCQVGSHCVFANNGTLGGHVIVEDHAIIGGLSAVHQFVRIGRLAIIGGCTKATQDITPYAMCDGRPAKIRNINSIGLKRAKKTMSSLKALKQAYKILFFSELSTPNALKEIQANVEQVDEVKELISFVESSERGICR